MNYKYRRRSESRDSSRRYSSDDRSVSRSRSPRRYRRSSSRSKRSYSKSRRYSSHDRRSYSSSYSSEDRYRDRRRHSSPSLDNNKPEKRPPNDPEPSSAKMPPRRRARNMAWKLPTLNDTSRKNNNFIPPKKNSYRRFKPRNTFDSTANKNVLVDYKYESDEFKTQKENLAKVLKEKEEANKENQRLLAEYTSELNTLIGNLSRLSKDSPEYRECSEKILSLKKAMKDLTPDDKPVNKFRHSKPTLERNIKLDNRETKVFFSSLPECAKGKGNLAKWISQNSKILLPNEIAMLASQGNSFEAAVIQYKNHEVAQKVLNSCKLHGFSVSWLPTIETETSRSDDQVSLGSDFTARSTDFHFNSNALGNDHIASNNLTRKDTTSEVDIDYGALDE